MRVGPGLVRAMVFGRGRWYPAGSRNTANRLAFVVRVLSMPCAPAAATSDERAQVFR